MLVAVSLLAISLSFLLYQHPPSTWRSWLRDDTPPTEQIPLAGPPKDDRDDNGQAQNQTRPEQQESPETTPKALPSLPSDGVTIPTLKLGDEDAQESDSDTDEMPPPSFPALNSAQRASSQPRVSPMGPPIQLPTPRPSNQPVSSLMPPPQLKASNLRALPTPQAASASLRVPTTGPLPNRGPAPSQSPNASLALPLSGVAPQTPNARGKILLSPGHSPLDWANLQRSGKNLSGVSSLIRVTPSMLKQNNGQKGRPAWSVYQGRVYNITPYLPFHPGGEGELRRAAGKDGTKLFMEVHPWVNWENMLGECVVGILVSEEPVGSSLEDMD
ncbi:hypothetical protein M011DRAFT_491404 [Sporormia fimetaria CBS 119925]|uniref:Cytochrome b5 heme-binding domain-containing protein n=1 Tax=Sporormia fimetaria CBS 119925 TaxID=1340428 RepID=A0A6A6VMQ9_9PLEO|nr:hypothetical protein M011DRAFT_491404 [Sporormia fimetaria CBS 119925]